MSRQRVLHMGCSSAPPEVMIMAHGMWRPLSWDVTECLLPFLPRTALSPAALQHGETPCCYPGWVSNPIGAKDSCPLVPCSSRALCVLMQLLHAISDAPVLLSHPHSALSARQDEDKGQVPGGVHGPPTPGAGEGISLQPLHHHPP